MINFRLKTFFALAVCLILFQGYLLNAQSLATSQAFGEINRAAAPLFPQALFTSNIASLRAQEAARPFWVFTESESQRYYNRYFEAQSILLNNDILAYYGHPLSTRMGILGRHTKEELAEMLGRTANAYRLVSNGRGVQKAFHIIFGTAWPEGEIGIIREAVLTEYIEYALENNILVFIDHQMGRFDPIDSLRRMLPWLRYPNVHLALDPEWRTSRPMQEIGYLTAEEINRAQRVMEDYIIENNIPGERLLLIHQFNRVMIRNRENIRADLTRVRLVLNIAGWGHPQLKRDTYAFGALATNIPVKGFKLWYEGLPGVHFDNPLMSPADVMNLNPRPFVVMYQ